MKKLLFIFGTRPEAIKLAPLIIALNGHHDFSVKVCVTGQHRDMLDSVMDFFSLKADYDLEVMQSHQTLFDISSRVLKGLEIVMETERPDLVIVQGDTTTAFNGALAAFYKKIKVAHVEAGLRSYDKWSPFPEEVNRKLVSAIADIHFTPTQVAADHLVSEKVIGDIRVTGNTVIDALFFGVEQVKKNNYLEKQFSFLDTNKRVLLVTGHRRESFGEPFEQICESLVTIGDNFPDIQIVYPVHLNPNVQEPVNRILSGRKNIFLLQPVDYPSMIWLLNHCYLVITDSGGIQEEAPSLGKPVLVMRDVTERMEGIQAGTAQLVGTNKMNIVAAVTKLLNDDKSYNKMARAINPYGDGKSSQRIISILKELL